VRSYQHPGDLTREECTKVLTYYAAGMLAEGKYGPICYHMTVYSWAILWKLFTRDAFGHLDLDETENHSAAYKSKSARVGLSYAYTNDDAQI
jgi:hypothetical protein